MRRMRSRQCHTWRNSARHGGARHDGIRHDEVRHFAGGKSKPWQVRPRDGTTARRGVWADRWFCWLPLSRRGSVTAEFAVVLPAVTALLALLLLGAGAGVLQLRLEEGARAGARALARGESTAQAAAIARNLSGGAATVSADLAGGYATVTVTARVTGPLAAMMPWQQSARAIARMEIYEPAEGPTAGPPAGISVPLRKTALWRWVHAPNGECGSLTPAAAGCAVNARDVRLPSWDRGSHGFA